jgi:hypothetical protein
VTTGEFFITDAHEDDVFPNEDFFPDIDNLFGACLSLTTTPTAVQLLHRLQHCMSS